MANGHGTELTAEGAADTKMMSPEELLEHEALSQEEENDRLRQEIQAVRPRIAHRHWRSLSTDRSHRIDSSKLN